MSTPREQRSTGPALGESPLRDLLVEKIDAGTLELPILPSAATDVLGACRDDACDARKLADIIQRDQSLSSHILRVANSAAYRPPQPIVSMPQAISRLGFRTLCEIAIAVTLKGRIFKVPRFDAVMRALWMHSAAAGAYAKEIARLRRRNVEGAFLCGLLHDVGRPVILQFAVDAERAARKPFPDAEITSVCDELHAPVGAALIRRWEFPDWMVAAIEHHHDPDGPDQREETRMTSLADSLAHWALELDADDTAAVVSLPLLIDLNIYEDEIRGLLQARDAIREVAQAFA